MNLKNRILKFSTNPIALFFTHRSTAKAALDRNNPLQIHQASSSPNEAGSIRPAPETAWNIKLKPSNVEATSSNFYRLSIVRPTHLITDSTRFNLILFEILKSAARRTANSSGVRLKQVSSFGRCFVVRSSATSPLLATLQKSTVCFIEPLTSEHHQF